MFSKPWPWSSHPKSARLLLWGTHISVVSERVRPLRCLWTGKELVSLASALSPKKCTSVCLQPLEQQANIQLSATETPGVLPGRLLRRHCCFPLYPHCSPVPQHCSKERRPCPGQVTELWTLCLEAVSFLSYANNSVLTPGSFSPDVLHPYSHLCVPGAALVLCSPEQPAPLAS